MTTSSSPSSRTSFSKTPWQLTIRASLRGLTVDQIAAAYGPSMARAFTKGRQGNPACQFFSSAGCLYLAASEGYAQYHAARDLAHRMARLRAA